MNLTSFKQMVQTFGANPKRWETENVEEAFGFAAMPAAASALAVEQNLDEKLDLFSVPFCDNLNQRLFSAIMNETGRKYFFFFIRQATWISLLFMIGGFYLGWHGSQQKMLNTESYFSAMFDVTIY